MSFSFFSRIYAMLWAPASTVLMLYMIIPAWKNGTWKVVLNFNKYGEGYMELVLLTVLLLVNSIASFTYFRDLLD